MEPQTGDTTASASVGSPSAHPHSERAGNEANAKRRVRPALKGAERFHARHSSHAQHAARLPEGLVLHGRRAALPRAWRTHGVGQGRRHDDEGERLALRARCRSTPRRLRWRQGSRPSRISSRSAGRSRTIATSRTCGDGRGYTVTNYGFCTGTGEVSELIKLYMEVVPDTPLKHYLALMPPAVDTEGTPAALSGRLAPRGRCGTFGGGLRRGSRSACSTGRR